ncbi:MAG TPA: FkbM family methyltransferase [Gemmataceae bacterium]|nr:FkbM family methyltransferase [Gemmataceae bacterium]
MDTDLIIDVGLHQGEDTGFYLHRGYRVVAVDADERLIARARQVYADAVRRGRLHLVHCAVADTAGEVAFHLSGQTLWNSLRPEVSARRNLHQGTVTVPARRLPDLFDEYGVPLYCKIDIEGYDAVCLATLEEAAELPRYLSVETECVGEAERLTDAQALETLQRLHRLGYRRFKLVDQASLMVLSPERQFYGASTRWDRLWERLGLTGGCRCHTAVRVNRRRLCQRHRYDFPPGASGPFGEELDGRWLDVHEAREALLRHRRDYFRMPSAKNYGFWCDWHAAF